MHMNYGTVFVEGISAVKRDPKISLPCVNHKDARLQLSATIHVFAYLDAAKAFVYFSVPMPFRLEHRGADT